MTDTASRQVPVQAARQNNARVRLRGRFDAPSVIAALIIAAILTLLVLNPLFRLIIDSFLEPGTGAFTLKNYVTAYGRPRHITALINTVQLAAAVSFIAALIAVPLAWGVARTDMPGRNATHLSVIAAFIIPPFLGAIGWVLLAGPNAGWLNRAFIAVTGAEQGPFNIFSFWGMSMVIAIYTFPLIYIFTSSAFELISTEMEEAAAIHGAGPMAATFRVTIPLALPAILGGTIIVFLETMALFGTVAILGIPARYNVMTTQLAVFFEHPLRVEVASAYSMALLLITVVLLLMQKVILARRSYVSVGGKGGERRLVRLGPWRWALSGYALLVGLFSVILPTVVLTTTALSRAWGRGLSWDNLTLDNFNHILFEQLTMRQSMWNTFSYSAISATVCVLLGFGIAYIVQRRAVPFAGGLAFVSIAPFAIPGIVLAVCFYAAYAGPPFSLYGTGLLIIMAFVTRFMPVAFVTASSGVRGLHPELEEAARIMGAGRLTAIRRVVAPLLKKTMLGAWILIFIIATRELSTAVFLSGPQTRVISLLTLDLSEEGRYEPLAAMGVILLFVTTAVVAIGMKVVGRDFMLRRG